MNYIYYIYIYIIVIQCYSFVIHIELFYLLNDYMITMF